MRTGHTLGPAQLAEGLEALAVIDEVSNVDQQR